MINEGWFFYIAFISQYYVTVLQACILLYYKNAAFKKEFAGGRQGLMSRRVGQVTQRMCD